MDFCSGQRTNVRAVVVGPNESIVLSPVQSNGCGRILYNETGTLFVTYGPTCKKDLFTAKLAADKEHQVNFYSGVISAIKLSGTSNVYVTEVYA